MVADIIIFKLCFYIHNHLYEINILRLLFPKIPVSDFTNLKSQKDSSHLLHLLKYKNFQKTSHNQQGYRSSSYLLLILTSTLG